MGKNKIPEAATRILRCIAKGMAEQAKASVPGAALVVGALSAALDETRGLGNDERKEALDALKQADANYLKDLLAEQADGIGALNDALRQSLAEIVRFMAESLSADAEILGRQDALASLIERMAQDADRQHSLVRGLLREALERLNSGPTIGLPVPRTGDTPLARLQYQREWIALIGREQEERELSGFAERGDRFLWWQVVGPGGSGKSRLALKWLRDLAGKGWDVGFLRSPTEWLNESGQHSRWIPRKDTAFVIDYSSEHGKNVGHALENLSASAQHWPSSAKVRVLLLDREAGGRSWMSLRDSVSDTLGKAQESCHRTAMPEHGMTTDTRPQPLRLRGFEDADKRRQILLAVADKMGKPAPPYTDKVNAYFDRVSGGGLPIFLVAGAMRLVESGEDDAANRSEGKALLNDILRDEIEHWGKTWRHEADGFLWTALLGSVGFVTLCNGLDHAAAAEVLPRVVPEAGNVSRQSLRNALAALLPPGEKGTEFGALSPDLLGEHFLLVRGAPPDGHSHPFPMFDPSRWIVEAARLAPNGLFNTLLRICLDYPESRDPVDWVKPAASTEPWDDDFPAEAVGPLWVVVNALKMPSDESALQETVNIAKRLAGHSEKAATSIARITALAIGTLGGQGAWQALEAFGTIYHTLPDTREIRLEEAKAAVNAINHYGGAGDFPALERWAARLDRLFQMWPCDGEMLAEILDAACIAFVRSPEPHHAQRLARLAEHAPWIQPRENAPRAAVLFPRFLREQGQNTPAWQPLHERAGRLLNEVQAAQSLLDKLRDKELDANAFKRLWTVRRFMPNWGKGLWGQLAQLPETGWIGEAMADPWTNPQEREALEALHRKKG